MIAPALACDLRLSPAPTLADEVRALRTRAVVAAGDHLACVRVRGAGAHDLVDRISPRELFVRSGQLLHTLLLDEAALPIADVYIGCDDDDYLIIAEGMTGLAVADYLAARAGGLDVAIEDTSQSHGFLCLGGPYAWEVLAELTSPEVIGLPYLGFFHERAERSPLEMTCFRAGKTGEYGYDLWIPREQIAGARDRLAEVGRAFDLVDISPDALEVAALENWFWNPRRDVRPGLTPVELQLQWRVTYGRAFPGSDALAARRKTARQRVVLAASPAELVDDAPITAGDCTVGAVLHAAWSPTLERWLAMALLDRRIAHAGLTGLVAHTPAGAAPLRTLSAPALTNRSLFVDPQRHGYATRDSEAFPPLVRP
jgi:glycine cleavage system aminomethyltransferase T